ncbi:hypothetical protein [Mameliella sediminis]|uniref:hypothetical protein n=1 Tax=Mameliella sediminis TaxID=2836866 RepID=UPI001C464B7C|nr:hypothetical protein [Mameliella sediminis]MBV7393510.1 hypothetical protein [Mameliella sediminis]MBY6161090.1 hypothetical protein [Mameliella alba]MBY6169560.1 hypothetical protein [Mameliella alba]MBY6174579.1 hypothetical protein [Mameliella alba]
MSDLKNAILDAKYIDMIDLGDFVVRDTGLPDVDSDGNLMPQATEIAAAVFRWAADMKAAEAARAAADPVPAQGAPTEDDDDRLGDPLADAPNAEALDAELHKLAQEQG